MRCSDVHLLIATCELGGKSGLSNSCVKSRPTVYDITLTGGPRNNESFKNGGKYAGVSFWETVLCRVARGDVVVMKSESVQTAKF